MDRIGYRFVGAVVGFLIGCGIWVAFYFLMQGLMGATGADHVRFRAPLFFFILPIFTAVIGFKLGLNGDDVSAIAKDIFGRTGRHR
jgi:hypothetical protein